VYNFYNNGVMHIIYVREVNTEVMHIIYAREVKVMCIIF
jgi:hypothetical protein